MANDVVIYTVIHQPKRPKLPAQPIPKDASPQEMEGIIFDSAVNRYYFDKVSRTCYYPASDLFNGLVESGFKLSLGFSVSFLKQAEEWDVELLNRFKTLVRRENVELVCVEPYHSFIFYLDIDMFIERMKWGRDYLQNLFGKEISVTDTTEMFMSNDVYYALNSIGFAGALMEGQGWQLGSNLRQPTYLYHQNRDMVLLARHRPLSDDVGYRFSDRTWDGYPLYADDYAQWLRDAEGDFVLIGWDFETFGEHHYVDSGIFEFMMRLPYELDRRGVGFLLTSEVIKKYSENRRELTLPAEPSTWAGSGGMDFFLGNSAQSAIFQLMHAAYNIAKLSENPDLLDIASWLAQSDNLHLIQWFGKSGPEANVSAYFTPRQWWDLGDNRIIWELQQIYKNFIQACIKNW
ncbi:TPA: glycoside hydrolase [Candidatus Poribacteria bacterium]|nr:glycoside hydrolase [Candidatus Poribacteria bacterium]